MEKVIYDIVNLFFIFFLIIIPLFSFLPNLSCLQPARRLGFLVPDGELGGLGAPGVRHCGPCKEDGTRISPTSDAPVGRHSWRRIGPRPSLAGVAADRLPPEGRHTVFPWEVGWQPMFAGGHSSVRWIEAPPGAR